MRDVRPAYSHGLAIGSMLLFLAVAIASPATYRAFVRKHERGIQEQGTVICLVPAIAFGLLAIRHSRELPARKWLTGWLVLFTLGALYFGGEECSWGQNYVHWSTPEYWARINDQQETNLHNTSNLLDHLPRALLTLAAGFCAVSPFVFRRLQKSWNPRTNPLVWLLPTTAVVPAAALAILVGIPQKFYGHYDKTNEAADWFSEVFLAGRHSEMKEYFLAMFMFMYAWSLATRLRTMSETAKGAGEKPRGESTGQGPQSATFHPSAAA